MKYVLVLWLTPLLTQSATLSGAIASVPVESHEMCVVALERVRSTAKYISGVCVQVRS